MASMSRIGAARKITFRKKFLTFLFHGYAIRSDFGFLITALLTAALSAACTRPQIVSAPPSMTAETSLATFQTIQSIQSILDKSGATVDYDTLMKIHQAMVRPPHPIAHADQLLRQLIHKRNEDPRVDQMILIFAAKIIGASPHAIPGAQELLASILEQDNRINEWVICFVAEAIHAYVYDLPQGDKLVDLMEAKLARLRSIDRSREEYFGFHFLPPPKSDFIRDYISGIRERRIRQQERNLYYILIRNGLTETQIETASRFLKAHGAPGSGEKCPRLMQCLMRNRNRLPFQ